MDKFLVDFDAALDELEAEECRDDVDLMAHVSSSKATIETANIFDLKKLTTNEANEETAVIRDDEENVTKVNANESQSNCVDDLLFCERETTENDLTATVDGKKETVEELIVYRDNNVIDSNETTAADIGDSCCVSDVVCELEVQSNVDDKDSDGKSSEERTVNASKSESALRFDDCVVTNLTEEEINTYLSEIEDQIDDNIQLDIDLNLPAYLIAKSTESALNSNCSEVNVQTVHATRPSSLMLPNTFADSDGHVVEVDSSDSPSGAVCETVVQKSVIDGEFVVGKFKPFWIPDNDASSCMSCDSKFTVIKRRHHCRACGKVLCSQCCNSKAKLAYLSNKEARVCSVCLPLLSNPEDENNCTATAASGDTAANTSGNRSYPNSPNPNNPSEYCSSIPPLEQAEAAIYRPPPTVFVPVGVLKRGNKPRGEPKQVVFSDGIRPGSDLSENDSDCVPNFPIKGRQLKRLKSPSIEKNSVLSGSLKFARTKNNRITVIDSNGPLPPIVNCSNLPTDANAEKLLRTLQDDDSPPVCFYLNKNLHAVVKIVSLDCCMQNTCWLFASKGLSTAGQDELLVVLEKFPDESCVPRDVFRLFTRVNDYASRGSPFGEMSHISFTEGLFDNKDNNGFIFIKPTFQCLKKFLLPTPPYLVALLLHKCEIPWAKIFPLRLLLRLGAQYKYYPCPLVSYRNRKPAYFEVGHTILNVLADFRNFQYTLPCISGLVIHMEDKKTKVNFPRNRYDQVMKALSSSNEHVLAFAANFSTDADSHLTCVQYEDGQYQTQTMGSQDSSRLVTGASFIVFSGALKSTTGLSAKMSVVEDGLLVQIPPSTMEELKSAFKNRQDFSIKCGKIDAASDDVISISWSKEDKNYNIGVRSSIDGMSLEGIQSVRIYNGTDYAGDKYFIRWTEVFFIENDENSRRGDNVDPTRLAGITAQSLCLALTPHLEHLVDNNLVQISLRVTLDPEKVGYDVGSNGCPLPAAYVNELDGALIPVIMGSAANVDSLLVMELLFHILVK